MVCLAGMELKVTPDPCLGVARSQTCSPKGAWLHVRVFKVKHFNDLRMSETILCVRSF